MTTPLTRSRLDRLLSVYRFPFFRGKLDADIKAYATSLGSRLPNTHLVVTASRLAAAVSKTEAVASFRKRVPVYFGEPVLSKYDANAYNGLKSTLPASAASPTTELLTTRNAVICDVPVFNDRFPPGTLMRTAHVYGVNFESNKTADHNEMGMFSSASHARHLKLVKESILNMWSGLLHGAVAGLPPHVKVHIRLPAIGMGAFANTVRQNEKMLWELYCDGLKQALQSTELGSRVKLELALTRGSTLDADRFRATSPRAIVNANSDLFDSTLVAVNSEMNHLVVGDAVLVLVNAWDSHSLIGNGGFMDRTIDGFFVADANFVNSKAPGGGLLNASYLANIALLFAPEDVKYDFLYSGAVEREVAAPATGSGAGVSVAPSTASTQSASGSSPSFVTSSAIAAPSTSGLDIDELETEDEQDTESEEGDVEVEEEEATEFRWELKQAEDLVKVALRSEMEDAKEALDMAQNMLRSMNAKLPKLPVPVITASLLAREISRIKEMYDSASQNISERSSEDRKRSRRDSESEVAGAASRARTALSHERERLTASPSTSFYAGGAGAGAGAPPGTSGDERRERRADDRRENQRSASSVSTLSVSFSESTESTSSRGAPKAIARFDITQLPIDFANVIRGTAELYRTILEKEFTPYDFGQGGIRGRVLFPLRRGTALSVEETGTRICEVTPKWSDHIMNEDFIRRNASQNGYVYFSTPFYVMDPSRGLSGASTYRTRADGRKEGTVKGLTEQLLPEHSNVHDHKDLERLIKVVGPLTVFGTGIELQQALNDSDIHSQGQRSTTLKSIQPMENPDTKGDYEFTDVTPRGQGPNLRVVVQSQLKPDGSPTGRRFIVLGLGSLKGLIDVAYNNLVTKLTAVCDKQQTAEFMLLKALLSISDPHELNVCKKLINTEVVKIANLQGIHYQIPSVRDAFKEYTDRIADLSDLSTVLARARRVATASWWSVLKESLEVSDDKMLCIAIL